MLLNIVGIMLAVKVGMKLFGLVAQPFPVIGLAMATFVLLHSIYNRNLAVRNSQEFWLIPFLVAIAVAISLCALSIIVPFLRS